MRNLFLTSAAAATLLAGLGGPAFAQQRGGGSGGPPGQQGGQAAAPAGQPTGSFNQSCRNTQVQGGVVSAECLDTQGRYRMSSLPFTGCRSGVSNNNGVLYCEGATANAGAYVTQAPAQGGGNRTNNNNKNGAGFAAGVAAGAILGGALSGGNVDIYTPGARYPTFGDQHYGDPRYDPRYGPNGWGYGHRPGEFVMIRDRANWFGRQIDDGVRAGRIDRGEERDLRRQLADLIGQEDTYRRQGLAPWMRADLDKKFDQLAFRLRIAARDNGRRDDNRGGYGR